MKRDGLELLHRDDGAYVLKSGSGSVPMDEPDLRWLCLIAGPAMLAEHDPPPKHSIPEHKTVLGDFDGQQQLT